MRIAIDYTAAIRQQAGIGHYTRSLVEAMLALDSDNQYTLLTSGRPSQEHPFPEAENVRGRGMLIPDRYLNILWYRWRAPLYANLFAGGADIYHGPDFALPPIRGKIKQVVTIHDLAFLDHPEYAVPSLAAYLARVVPRAVEQADMVAAVSEATRQALVAHYGTPAGKITIIPNGVGPHFRRITDPVILGATRHKFGLTEPFVLAVGTLEPRKNHMGLIKAFHKMCQQQKGPELLAIAGGKGWLYEETKELVANLHLEKKVLFLGRVSELELISLYSMAEIFAFPSFFEGFGIPPLEAMTCGAPVLSSNISSLPEVVGDAALLADPHNIDEMSDRLIQLSEDADLRDRLREKGYERAKLFSWEASARKMLTVYEKLYNGVTDFSEV